VISFRGRTTLIAIVLRHFPLPRDWCDSLVHWQKRSNRYRPGTAVRAGTESFLARSTPFFFTSRDSPPTPFAGSESPLQSCSNRHEWSWTSIFLSTRQSSEVTTDSLRRSSPLGSIAKRPPTMRSEVTPTSKGSGSDLLVAIFSRVRRRPSTRASGQRPHQLRSRLIKCTARGIPIAKKNRLGIFSASSRRQSAWDPSTSAR